VELDRKAPDHMVLVVGRETLPVQELGHKMAAGMESRRFAGSQLEGELQQAGIAAAAAAAEIQEGLGRSHPAHQPQGRNTWPFLPLLKESGRDLIWELRSK
jgi:hypothetical protein